MSFDFHRMSPLDRVGNNRSYWHYFTTDPLATVLADNYFVSLGMGYLVVGDILHIVASGGTEMETAAVAQSSGGHIVLTQSSALGGPGGGTVDLVARAAAATAQAVAEAALARGGGTMTGPIVLAGDGAAPLNPASRQQLDAALQGLIDSSPATLDTLNELAAALGDDANFAGTVTNSLALKAPLASPALTGVPTAPTAAPGTNTTQLATTAHALAAALANGPVTSVFGRTGPVAAAAGDYGDSQVSAPTSSTNLGTLGATVRAWLAAIDAKIGLLAPLASPALTGVPTAPTAAAGTNTTQLATTAHALAAAIANGPVTGVFGRSGAVVAAAADYSDSQVSAPTSSTNLGTLTATVRAWLAAIDAKFSSMAPLASPALTGTPTAPTATTGTNTTQLATTAYADAAAALRQAASANLAAFAGLSGVADRLAYFTAAATLALATFTATGRAIVGAASAALARVQVNQGAVALTDGATIATDCSLGNFFTVTLGGNRTLGNPTNLAAGASYVWCIRQDGTGSRTLAYGGAFDWGAAGTPVLTTTLNKYDYISGYSPDGTKLHAAITKGFA